MDKLMRKQKTQGSQDQTKTKEMVFAKISEKGSTPLGLRQKRKKSGGASHIQKRAQGHEQGGEKCQPSEICRTQGPCQEKAGAKRQCPACTAAQKTADQAGFYVQRQERVRTRRWVLARQNFRTGRFLKDFLEKD
jgi:hypothetical protein